MLLTRSTEKNTSEEKNNNSNSPTQPHLNKKFQRQYFIENLDDPHKIAFLAAQMGDDTILKLLIDPAPLTNPQIIVKIKFAQYMDEHAPLQRKLEIRKINTDIFCEYYKLHGRKIHHYNVLGHINKIKNQISHRLLDYSESCRLEHRRMLKESREIIHNGKLTELNLALRVKIHKEFSFGLAAEMEVESLNFNHIKEHMYLHMTLKKVLHQYNTFLKEAPDLQQQLERLKEEAAQTIISTQETDENRKKIFESNEVERFSILNEVYAAHSAYFSNSDNAERLWNFLHNMIPPYHRETTTGNNLIHLALRAGQFETGLLLKKMGVDAKERNFAQLPAMDVQDQNGDTLLHYLARRGAYDLICEFIREDANFHLENNTHQTVLDITSNEFSLIHYLLQKILLPSKTQEYLGILLRVFSGAIKLSTLLLKDNLERTAIQIISGIPDLNLRKLILRTLNKNNSNIKFESDFQNNLNFVLWLHFNHIINAPVPTPNMLDSLKKVLGYEHDESGHAKNLVLEFLQTLQQKIWMAAKNKCDTDLYRYLSKALKENKLTEDFHRKYQIYLDTAFEIKRTKKENPYFIIAKKPSKDILSKSNPLLIVNAEADSAEASLSSEAASQPAVFDSPIKKRTPAKKEKAIDPWGWFEVNNSHSYKK